MNFSDYDLYKLATPPEYEREESEETMSEVHYGVVRILRGPYKGTCGLFDDDGENSGEAVVYPDEWPNGGHVLLKEADLEDASELEAARWWAKSGNRDLWESM